jgi:hypothetical protein
VEKRLAIEPDPRLASRFLVLTIPAKLARGIYRQTPQRRAILVAAWNAGLEKAAVRATSALRNDLRDKGIEVDNATIQFADEIAMPGDDPRQWAARQALVEYGLREPVDFQGYGDILVSAGDEASVNELVGKLLAQQLGGQLEQLLGGRPRQGAGPEQTPGWLKSAVQKAEAKNARGFAVKQLEPDTGRSRIGVRIYFFARMPDGKWERIAQFGETAVPAEQRAADAEQLANDPQVRQAVGLLETLGLKANPAQLQLALSYGAAVQAAHAAADAKFLGWQQAYLRRLDSPPLVK